MSRSSSTALAAPPRGFLARLLQRVRWAFGAIQASDLTDHSDAELMTLAEDFVRRNKLPRASLVLAAFAQRTTMEPRILQRYGDVSRAVGSHDSAIFSYLQAAELYLHAGVVPKASALLLQLVRAYPDHVDARLALARVLESQGRNKEAAASYAVVARVFEAHGQHHACGPLLTKIAELWPMARADYAREAPPHMQAMADTPIVVGEARPIIDDSKPIELDLESLISAFALGPDASAEVHNAPTASVGSYDPRLLAAAGHEPSTVCVPDDPWLGSRPAIGAPPPFADADGRTASYQVVDADRTIMDMQGLDTDTGRDHASADATIMDLHAIRDEGAARVIDLSETEREPSPARSPPGRAPSVQRRLSPLKRTSV